MNVATAISSLTYRPRSKGGKVRAPFNVSSKLPKACNH
jgi:hypothetical protein